MCYRVSHSWSCGHDYAWSAIRCPAARIEQFPKTARCEQLVSPEDPDMRLREDIPCPECQKLQRAVSVAPDRIAQPQVPDQAARAEAVEPSPEDKEIVHELAALEREIEDLEAGDLDAALRESAHHHSLAHEAELDEAKSRSLIDAPEQQSPEAYAEDMQRAREVSEHHWAYELGMAVYADHERAVQRARLESYRDLLAGYTRLKEGLGKAAKGERGRLEDAFAGDATAIVASASLSPSHSLHSRQLSGGEVEDGKRDPPRAFPTPLIPVGEHTHAGAVGRFAESFDKASTRSMKFFRHKHSLSTRETERPRPREGQGRMRPRTRSVLLSKLLGSSDRR